METKDLFIHRQRLRLSETSLFFLIFQPDLLSLSRLLNDIV